jgi:hypothetical protein
MEQMCLNQIKQVTHSLMSKLHTAHYKLRSPHKSFMVKVSLAKNLTKYLASKRCCGSRIRSALILVGWIRIQSVFPMRIRIRVGNYDPKTSEKCKVSFWKLNVLPSTAGDFSCRLDFLHGGKSTTLILNIIQAIQEMPDVLLFRGKRLHRAAGYRYRTDTKKISTDKQNK